MTWNPDSLKRAWVPLVDKAYPQACLQATKTRPPQLCLEKTQHVGTASGHSALVNSLETWSTEKNRSYEEDFEFVFHPIKTPVSEPEDMCWSRCVSPPPGSIPPSPEHSMMFSVHTVCLGKGFGMDMDGVQFLTNDPQGPTPNLASQRLFRLFLQLSAPELWHPARNSTHGIGPPTSKLWKSCPILLAQA